MAENYSPVRALAIQGFTHTEIQGVPVPGANITLPDGTVPNFSLVGVEMAEPGYESPLRRISDIHGRSFELMLGAENAVFWSDEYGNIFSQVNTKGNNLMIQEVCRSGVSSSGFAIYGMQESDAMVRVLRTSDLLRSKQIDTEMTLQLIEPAELPYNGELIPLEQFKARLAKDVWEQNASGNERCRGLRSYPIPTREDIPRLTEALSNTTLFISIRGVQVNERLVDLEKAETFVKLIPMIRNAFRYVNTAEQMRAEQDPSYTPERFSLDNENDVMRYFTDYLPKRLAKNYAGLHSLGLVHIFPHSGNISTVGSIYDLDSVQGEPLGLGDSPVTVNEVRKDVLSLIDGSNGFSDPPEIVGKILGNDDNTFRDTFLTTYIEEMGWIGDIRLFDTIEELWRGFEDKDPAVISGYTDPITERLGLPGELVSDDLKFQVMHEILIENNWMDHENLRKAVDEEIEGILEEIEEAVSPVVSDGFVSEVGIEDSTERYVYQRIYLELRPIIQRITETLSTYPDQAELSKVDRYGLLRDVIAAEGYEDNIIEIFPLIKGAFYDFQDLEIIHMREYYLPLLEQALGWQFRIPESIEEMIAIFHEHDSQEAKDVLESIFQESTASEDREEQVNRAFEKEGAFRDYSWHHQDRYTDFIVKYIPELLEAQRGEELRQLEDRYGVEIATEIRQFIEDYQTNQLSDAAFDAAKGSFEQDTAERLEQVVAEVAAKYGFSATAFAGKIECGDLSELDLESLHAVILARGWDKDIISHISKIYDAFEGFGMPDHTEYFQFYLKALEQQVGIGPELYEVTSDHIIPMYLSRYGESLRRYLVSAVEKAGPGKSVEEIVSEASEEGGYDKYSEWTDEWIYSIDEYMYARIKQYYGQEIETQIRNHLRTGEERERAKEVIYDVLTEEVQRALYALMTPEDHERIAKQEQGVWAMIVTDVIKNATSAAIGMSSSQPAL